MPLYPSLEDMNVHHMATAQIGQMEAAPHEPVHAPSAPLTQTPYPLHPTAPAMSPSAPLYPTLDEYMGFNLKALEEHAPPPSPSNGQNQQGIVPRPLYGAPAAIESFSSSGLIAPLSGNSVGLIRAHVTHGVREVKVCKNAEGKIGLRAKAISNGVFVQLVEKDSPAALAGLRFGDQILQIDGETVAGYTMDKTHKIFKNCPANGIRLAVRDRPFERTVTLHKSSDGFVGFQFRDGKIVSIVKDSSAARNGLLTDHHLLEVNGQNVVGLKDKEITKIIGAGGNIITLTLMPSVLFDHIMKHMAFSLVKSSMDHSVRDI